MRSEADIRIHIRLLEEDIEHIKKERDASDEIGVYNRVLEAKTYALEKLKWVLGEAYE